MIRNAVILLVVVILAGCATPPPSGPAVISSADGTAQEPEQTTSTASPPDGPGLPKPQDRAAQLSGHFLAPCALDREDPGPYYLTEIRTMPVIRFHNATTVTMNISWQAENPTVSKLHFQSHATGGGPPGLRDKHPYVGGASPLQLRLDRGDLARYHEEFELAPMFFRGCDMAPGATFSYATNQTIDIRVTFT